VAAPAETPLEQLVRDELRGPVSELVRQVVVELVREQLNGAAETAVGVPRMRRSRAYAPALSRSQRSPSGAVTAAKR
jgi:hypothetical protein